MKYGSAFARLLLLAVMPAALFISCQQSTGPGTPGVNGLGGSSATGNLYGRVVTTNDQPLAGITVQVGTLTTTTNTRGEFYLTGVPAATRLRVDFSSASYAGTQKIVTVPRGRTAFVDAALLPLGTIANVSSAGGAVNFNGARVDFPSAAFVDEQGAPFSGNAQVRATWFNPTTAVFTRAFPGDFEGVRTDGSVTAIESFGFVRVDIMNGTQKLQLAPGKLATITFPVPTAIRSRAPQTIPLWYYDEAKGQWIEEGTATLTGANYVGTVRHFSSWNCDQPQQTSYLEGRVLDSNGQPLPYASVNTEGVDYTGASRTVTNPDGSFRVPVKSSATAKVWASFFVVTSATQNVTTAATGQTLNIGTITLDADTSEFCIITGRLVDNAGQPLANMYLSQRDAANKTVDHQSSNTLGVFRFFGLTGAAYTITTNYYADSSNTPVTIPVTCPGTPATVDLGDIKLDIGGAYIVGRVVDGTGAPVAGVMVYAKGSSGSSGGQNREQPTDATGRFRLNIRPATTVDITFYYNQKSKQISATSGALGSTTDIGDVTLP